MFGGVFQLCKSKHCILYRSVERAEAVAVMWPACYLRDLTAAKGLAAAPMRDVKGPERGLQMNFILLVTSSANSARNNPAEKAKCCFTS